MMNYKKLNFTKLAVSITLTILLLGVSFSLTKIVNAQEEPENLSNLRILYQGQLFDSEGNPIADGRYNMRFRIYDAQEEWGNILWQEDYTFYNAISVEAGQFKVILGRENPINLNLDEAPFWLGIAIGTVTEEGEIQWAEEMEPRKKITTLSELLEIEELTPEQWENLSQLIKEKLGDQTDIVLLFDIAQLESLGTEPGIDFSSNIISFFQNFINFIDEKISEIGEKINQILAKIDSIIDSLANIVNTLAEMKHKIDVIYEVLIVQQGLESTVQVDICDSTHLNLCLTETDCIFAGGYWYDAICNAEEEVIEEEEEKPPTCTSEWSCSEWQPLPETIACGESFTQTRTCTDSNSCGTEEGKPIGEKEAGGTNDEVCGTTSCDTNLNLVGSCQNTCLEGSCQTCTPTCTCTEGFSDCDSDLTNGCETASSTCPSIEEPTE